MQMIDFDVTRGFRRAVVLGCVLLFGGLPCNSAVQADEWVALFFHIHTKYSTEELEWAAPIKLTVPTVVSRADGLAQKMGVKGAVTFTDHNNWDAMNDPAFQPVGAVRPISGIEWAVASGEVTVLGDIDKKLRDSLKRGDSMATYEKVVKLVHAQNGIVTACHPRSKVRWNTDERLGVDGIEVWNGIGWKTWDVDSLAWWNQLLVGGERITAMGASDAHTVVHPIECAMNLVFAKSNKQNDVLAALRAGRVMVLGGANAPRIYLAADTGGDDKYDGAMSGDALPVDRHGPVRFQVTVEKAGPDHRLFLVDRDGVFYSGKVGCGDGWNGNVYRFERCCKGDKPNFVRAEVRQQDCKTMESLCNPIYLPVKEAAK